MKTTKPDNSVPNPQVRKLAKLFRQEALDHAGSRLYGTAFDVKGPSSAWLIGIFASLGLLFFLYCMSLSAARKVEAQGMLIPKNGVIRVAASQGGVIKKRFVEEGQEVKEGEILFLVSTDIGGQGPNAPQLRIRDLLLGQKRSYEAEAKTSAKSGENRGRHLLGRLEGLKVEGISLNELLRLQKEKIKLSEAALARNIELRDKHYISDAQLQDRQMELIDQNQRLSEINRNIILNKRELEAVASEMEESNVKNDRDALALTRSASQLEQELTSNEARTEIAIRATAAGTVTSITGELGQIIPQGAGMATILPQNSILEAELYVPSRTVGFIRPGQLIRIKYQAFPYQKFGQQEALVAEISAAPLAAEELGMRGALGRGATDGGSEPFYRIRAKIKSQHILAYGEKVTLKSGMRLGASIFQEERKVYEWILEPLLTLSAR